MSDLAHLAAEIFKRGAGRPRVLVALAGPPAAGKTTAAARLVELLGADAAVVPMDGFHFDNAILDGRGLRRRKGAPETFDVDGLASLLQRLERGGRDVAVPLFDRGEDHARGSAAIIPATARFVIVEGNYLLLDEDPWRALRGMFDLSVMLDVPKGELARRLVRRWREHGLDEAAARQRAFDNDMANVGRVLETSIPADIVIRLS